MRNYFMSSFIADQISQGAEFKKASLPLSTIDWLNIIHFSNESSAKNYYGLGADINEKQAYIKAVVEYYERKFFFDRGVHLGFNSTNGIAGHRFKVLARNAAISELFERDSLLCHWYSKTPFIEVKVEDDKVKKTMQEIRSEKILTLFYKTYLGIQDTYLCFLVNTETGGFALGLSSGKTSKENISKAFSEAIINLFLGHQGKSREELIQDFECEGLTSLKNHRTYWLHIKPLPDWVLKPTKHDLFKISQNSHNNMKEFHYTYGPINIVGIKISEIFTLNLGRPTIADYELLSRRLKLDNISNPAEAIEPHPIP